MGFLTGKRLSSPFSKAARHERVAQVESLWGVHSLEHFQMDQIQSPHKALSDVSEMQEDNKKT